MGADLYIKNMDRQAQYTGYVTKPEVGYFRDAYNDSNLLHKMELSYWRMDTEHPSWFLRTDDGTELTVAGCFGLLELIKSREDMLKPDDDDAEEQFEALVKLLNKAIELNSPIIWSV